MSYVPESKKCKRGCCCTFGLEVCAKAYKCRCHATSTGVHAARLRLEDLLDALGDE